MPNAKTGKNIIANIFANSNRFELKAWQLARHRVGQKIRKKVWDDMEVKGKSINGIEDIISVGNYPMVPMTFDEMDTLEEVQAERKLAKEVSKTATDITGTVEITSIDPKTSYA